MKRRHLLLLLPLVPVVWLLATTADELPPPGPPADPGSTATDRTPLQRPSLAQPVPAPSVPPDPVGAKPTQQHAEAAAADDPPPLPDQRRLVLRGSSTPAAPAPFADGSGREAVRSALQEITPGLRDCYQQGLAIDPSLAGSLVLDLTIEARDGVGRIIDASIDEEGTTLQALLVQACALDQLSSATFPAPRDNGVIAVRYPLTFSAR